MFELALAYVNQAERERSITADLRRRQILGAPDATIVAAHAPSVAAHAPSVPRAISRSTGPRVRIAER